MAKRDRGKKSSKEKKILNLHCPYCGLQGVDVTIASDGTISIKCAFCQEERQFVKRPRGDGKTVKFTDRSYTD